MRAGVAAQAQSLVGVAVKSSVLEGKPWCAVFSIQAVRRAGASGVAVNLDLGNRRQQGN